jgi:LysM repeat protein
MSALVCPFIALATDSGKRLPQANAAHACFAQRPSQPIELRHQEDLCLTPTFSSCPLFVSWAAREAAQTINAAGPSPVGSGIWAASQSAATDTLAAAARGEGESPLPLSDDDTIWSLANSPQREVRPEEEERVRVVPLHQRRTIEDEVPRAMIRLPRLLSSLRNFSAFVLLLGVFLFAAPSILKGVGTLLSGMGSQPTPVASATATPDLSPTPVPTPEPVTYTIKSGDTLFGISQKFKVGIDAIIAANPNVKNPNNLTIGQQLIIPRIIPDVVISPSP